MGYGEEHGVIPKICQYMFERMWVYSGFDRELGIKTVLEMRCKLIHISSVRLKSHISKSTMVLYNRTHTRDFSTC